MLTKRLFASAAVVGLTCLSFAAVAPVSALAATASSATPCATLMGKRYMIEAEMKNKDGDYIMMSIVDFNAADAGLTYGMWAHKGGLIPGSTAAGLAKEKPGAPGDSAAEAFTSATYKNGSGITYCGVVTSSQGQSAFYVPRGQDQAVMDGKTVPVAIIGNGLFQGVQAKVYLLPTPFAPQ